MGPRHFLDARVRGEWTMEKRPGRPRLDDDDDSVPVHLTLTARQYDAVYERARRERVSVPEIIRRDVHAEAARRAREQRTRS